MSSWTHNAVKNFEKRKENTIMGKNNEKGNPTVEDQKRRLEDMTPEELESLRQEIIDNKKEHDDANEKWKAFVLREDNPLGLNKIQIWKIKHEVATRRLKTAGKIVAGAAATAIGWCLGSKHQEAKDENEVQDAIENGILTYNDVSAVDAPDVDVTTDITE